MFAITIPSKKKTLNMVCFKDLSSGHFFIVFKNNFLNAFKLVHTIFVTDDTSVLFLEKI